MSVYDYMLYTAKKISEDLNLARIAKFKLPIAGKIMVNRSHVPRFQYVLTVYFKLFLALKIFIFDF